ncbi:ice-binding family protein [uncultured Sphaerochaeta sp.]|uniref:ice-binding family protein n=1 Tax=uncultured Sphaerochaeta sp. TaxID=886478 RepID=UPI002A0A9A85|nr:ice-binding family protein [uncultured Sphaerochaeta sp.]
MKKITFLLSMLSLIFAVTLLGCSDAQTNPSDIPRVTSSDPADTQTNVPLNRNISVSFSETMNESTINASTFTVAKGSTNVDGTIIYENMMATFIPDSDLLASSLYSVTVTLGAENQGGTSMSSAYNGSFTTGTTTALGPKPVMLGSSGNFVILSKSGVSTVPTSVITGNVGTSPIDSTGLTGFALIADATNVFSTSSQVTGNLYASDYAVPTPSNLTSAISNMQLAYTDAAGRLNPDFTELGSGEIGGMTLAPGLYKWGTNVSISTDVTLSGGPNDVWIFQIGEGITVAGGKSVILAGGALAKNIFWQSAGVVSLGTTSHFEGIVLSQSSITMDTGASINGRLLAQTAISLDANTVTQPAL